MSGQSQETKNDLKTFDQQEREEETRSRVEFISLGDIRNQIEIKEKYMSQVSPLN